MISMFEANNKEELMKHNVSDLYQNRNKRKEISNKLLKRGYINYEEIKLKSLKGKNFWSRY